MPKTKRPRSPQYWLAELDQYDNPKLIDGSHETIAAVNKAAYLIQAMNLGEPGRRFAVAKVILSKCEPSAAGMDQQAVATINSAKEEIESTRHAQVRHLIWKAYAFANDGTKCPWDGRAAKVLKDFLASTPSWSLDKYRGALWNWCRSDVTHSAAPVSWIRNLPSYLSGPLDRYGKPKSTLKSTAQIKQDANDETFRRVAQKIAAQESDSCGPLVPDGKQLPAGVQRSAIGGVPDDATAIARTRH